MHRGRPSGYPLRLMRIAIDARELLGQPTGVGRYLAGILEAWDDLPEASPHEFVLCASEPVPFAQNLRIRASSLAGGGNRSGTLWEQWALPRLLRRARADVLFSPAYSGPLRCPVPMVIALHDVSFAAHPEWFSWREGMRRRVLTRLAARRAARVLTLTRFSRDEIVKHLGVAPEKIEITHAGVSRVLPEEGSRDAIVESSNPKERPVLFVGSIFNRRHVPELIGGFARLARKRQDIRLDIVGSNRTTPPIDLQATVDGCGAAGRVRLHSYVSDAELAGLYASASAFAWLSSYEGFGLPPLEALAAGVPIVALDTPVAREVFENAAVYVAEPRPELIEQALDRVLFDAGERDRTLGAAQPLLERYSWSNCSRRVLSALLAAGE